MSPFFTEQQNLRAGPMYRTNSTGIYW